MSKNRQNKAAQKETIHTILMIINPNPVTTQLRKRILTQRGSKDQLGIITPPSNQINQSNSTREIIFNTNLKNESSLSKLIRSQRFDTVYIDLKTLDPDSINNILKASENTMVSHIILSVSADNQADPSKQESIVDTVKQCGIHYTIVRRAKLNQYDIISYQTVHNARPVNDSSVSPSSVADLIYQTIKHPELQTNTDLGIAQLPYK